MADAAVDPRRLRGVLPRLERFLDPFVELLQRSAPGGPARTYVAGLVSTLAYQNVASSAYLHDQPREPRQQFLGPSPWDHRPCRTALVRPVGQQLGSPDGVLVCDAAAFPKQGTAAVGVQRQWCGRLGKVDNCPVGLFRAYVGPSEHALVAVRLYLPQEWAQEKQRRLRAGIPKSVRFRTRQELAVALLAERGPLLPHAWLSGDDELGRCSWFRQEVRARQACYLLAVPANTAIRDLTAPAPPGGGHGRRPSVPFTRVERGCAVLPAAAWETSAVRAGEQGPVVVQVVRTVVQARTEGKVSAVAEVLVVCRARQGDDTWKHDYLLSKAPLATPLAEFARVFKAQHRVEECWQRATGEAGLADWEVRTWRGW